MFNLIIPRLLLSSKIKLENQRPFSMSHFTKLKTKLYDRSALEKSLLDLNIKWESNDSKVRGYNNQAQTAEIVIKQKNNYDIGFQWNGTEYELVTDLAFWAQEYSVDKFLQQVNQRYAFNLITKASEEKNFQFVESETRQDGSIRLLLRKYS